MINFTVLWTTHAGFSHKMTELDPNNTTYKWWATRDALAKYYDMGMRSRTEYNAK